METLKVSSPRYMGCSGVSICLKCAPYVRPIFQGRYYRFPSFLPRVICCVSRTHLWAFLPYLVFSGFFAFSVGKKFINQKKTALSPPISWDKFFQKEMQKIKSPLRPKPLPKL